MRLRTSTKAVVSYSGSSLSMVSMVAAKYEHISMPYRTVSDRLVHPNSRLVLAPHRYPLLSTIVYKQLSKNLNDQAKLSLRSNEETTIIVFSNLSALAILNDLDKIKLSNTEFLCLSANIEKTLKSRGIKNTRISNQPTVENLISILTG